MMFDVYADQKQNRLYITINELNGDWLELLRDRVLEEISKLSVDFDCVSDLSTMLFEGEILEKDIGILADIETEMAKRGCLIAVAAGAGKTNCKFDILRHFYQIPQLIDMENAVAFLDNRRVE